MNIFENGVGVMNIAPTHLSGLYKVVVGIDDTLYLDNYCGRRVKLDMSQSFIEQVGRFLQVEQQISSNVKLQYGAFRRSGKVSAYHIPLYLGTKNELPELFCLCASNITDYTNIEELYSSSSILQIKSLKDLGLHSIFNEIYSQRYFDYPLYFGWDQHFVNIFGYNYKQLRVEKQTYNITDSVANQNYFEVVNNTILNFFSRNNLIYPRFINIEFEFEYVSQQKDFQDFFGFIGNQTEPKSNGLKFLGFNNPKFLWEQFTSDAPLQYNEIIRDIQINEVAPKLKQYRFGIPYLQGTEIFTVKAFNEIDFQYHFNNGFNNLESEVNKFCNACNQKYNYIFRFSYTKHKSMYIVTVDYINEIDINYTFEQSMNFVDVDNNNYEINDIRSTDVQLVTDIQLDLDTLFMFGEKEYRVIKQFRHSGFNFLRLDSDIDITKLTIVQCYKVSKKIMRGIEPISFYTFYSNLLSHKLYDNKSYIKQLKKFTPDGEVNQAIFDDAIREFSKEYNSHNEIYAYIDEIEGKLDINDLIPFDLHNESSVKNMMFSSGCNSHLLPYVFNYSREFYNQNCSVNPYVGGIDYYKYSWFLINSKAPEYIQNDIRSLRYYKDGKPQLWSRLYQVSDSICECIFLGIKYQLPVKFNGYQFCVVLYPDNSSNLEKITLRTEIDFNKKTIILIIDKFLDFNDLIRGTDYTKEPLIDLSLFYNVKNGFNLTSFYSTDINKLPLKLDLFKNHDTGFIIDGPTIGRNWFETYRNKNYICLQVDGPYNLKDIYSGFENGLDLQLSLYTEIEEYEENEIVTNKYQLCLVTFKNVIMHTTHFWCTDITLRWFPNIKNFYIDSDGVIHKLSTLSGTKRVNWSKTNKNDDFIQAQVTVGSDIKIVNILNPNKTHSFIQEWFEFTRTTTVGPNGHTDVSESVQSFTPNTHKKYNIGKDSISDYTINLFDTNQIWNYVRFGFQTLLNYRVSSSNQVRKEIDRLTIPSIINTLKVKNNNIIINDTKEYIQIVPVETDSNMVIWDMLDGTENTNKIVTIGRYNTAYFPLLFETNEIKFQLEKNKRYDSLFSMFHKNYVGIDISATGFWEELNGNILSTLFVGDDITTYIEYDGKSIDIKNCLKEHIFENKYVIGSKNEKLLSKTNMNIDEYIKEKYAEYLLSSCYKVSDIIEDDMGLSLKHYKDPKDNNKLIVNCLENTIIKLTFERI